MFTVGTIFHKMASLLFHKMASLLFHKMVTLLFYKMASCPCFAILQEGCHWKVALKILCLAETACMKSSHGAWLVLNVIYHILESCLRKEYQLRNCLHQASLGVFGKPSWLWINPIPVPFAFSPLSPMLWAALSLGCTLNDIRAKRARYGMKLAAWVHLFLSALDDGCGVKLLEFLSWLRAHADYWWK